MPLHRPIPSETQRLLARIYRYSHNRRASQRAHCLLLRSQGKKNAELRTIFLVSEKTLYNWFNGWDERGLLSLYDRQGRGRKAKLTDEQKAQVKQWADDSPRQLKPVIEKIKATWNISVSIDTLKRVLKSFKMSWRRMRRVTAKAPSADYERKRSALDILKALEATGAIDLYYLDETGFTLVPPIPYAWQVIGQTLEIPSQRSPRLNVLGFMTRQGALESYVSEQSITSDVVVACIEAFFAQVDKPTVIVMDQASIHVGHRVQDLRDEWAQRGLYLFELPTYSPELNLIETAWRFMKYQWLDSSAYESWESLVAEVEKILAGFGEEFVINFA
ncbi:IS630 family transposase [Leptothoe spongobia]|uniref:IS630 family transposase n=2 Tax=Leptothoe spongobia TAU-MAC 1115 TaxID=1967444 RepID=A0A947GM11_9CYAN|nr:IS630 family transposase [Leptothoe spongobia]MBT9317698.1 IS630 family transposase [Leptothoe spongobia TAU-MAC 1115]